MMDFLTNINGQFFIAAYLIGAIPFGLLLAKWFAKVDIKQSGSKSIGATNVLRVVKQSDPALAKKLSIATLVLDALKGVIVLASAHFFGVTESTLWGIAVLAVIGHCFSPYLNFEGGKGVATGVGVMLYMLPIETLIAIAVWLVAAKVIKISSISSLSALLTLIIASFYLAPQMPHAPVLLIAFIIFYKHIPNIIRLFTGQESKITS
jgi:acyl phosphate:glycerol-3-phosphate acyltransferase